MATVIQKTYICCSLKTYNMRNLITRTFSALIYAIIFLTAILFSVKSYIGLLILFAGICIWEFSKIINAKKSISYLVVLLVSLLSIYFILPKYESILLGFSLIGLSILLYLLFSLKSITYNSLSQKIFLKYIYIFLPFLFLAKLPIINNTYNSTIIIYIILIIWTNDSFAFLVGKNFGKRKLFKSVSPKKTIEGFIGGLLFSMIAGFLIGKYSGVFTITNWIIIAVIVSILGTLGDLVESKFKRQANVKDSGTIMPGHGGLLDRLDSLFFLAPFVYLYIHYIM